MASSALRVIASGAVLGHVLAAAFGRLIAAVLFGVQPLDFATFAGVTALLVVAAAVSVAGTAWRATKIDPAAALRTK